MPQPRGDDRGETQRQPRDETTETARAEAHVEDDRGHGRRRGLSQWFANTAVQAGLTVIGVVLLLFAIGQAVGLPLLEFAVDALSSRTGRWLVVAFFAILLIGAAQRIGATT